jgi:cytochrome c biogenesis protein CcmG, thiol:disulfide interchange protein DsbE
MKKRQYLFVLIIAGIILVAVIAGVKIGVWRLATDSAKPIEGYLAPNFTLPDLNGKKVDLKSVIAGNQVTLVNFWATWCPPCRMEIPEFVKFFRKYSSQRVTVLAVNLRDQPKTVKSFADKAGMKFPVLTDTTGKVGDLYQVVSIPNTFIIDRKGAIRAVVRGAVNLATLEEKVQPLLKGK